MKNNYKKKVSIISIVAFIIVALITISIKASLAKPDTNYLKNQSIDGISFEEANLEYKDGISTFTVNVYNNNKKDYELKKVTINVKGTDGKVTSLVSEVNSILESEEGRQISVTTNKDITDLISLEYKINK